MKHLSLDFWNTLGQPNPAYAEARNKILADFYDTTPFVAGQLYAQVKATVDRTHAATCAPLPIDICYALLSRAFGLAPDTGGPQYELEEAFAQHPPTMLPEAIEALKRIKASGVTISITSNTNFIRGAAIKTWVFANKFEFDFCLFSDEVGWAKPHQKMFGQLIEQSGREPKEIVHIGDSVECDVQGAERAGIRRVWVADPQAAAEELTLMAQRREMMA